MQGIIIQPKDKKEFLFISEILKKMSIRNKMLSVEDMEDFGLLKAMEEGRKSKFVSKEIVMKKLRKNVNKIP